MTMNVPVVGVEGLVAGDVVAGSIADDVAAGPVADDAEGFSGGLRDTSVLTSFPDDVSHNIWTGEERPNLKLASHGRKVEKIGRRLAQLRTSSYRGGGRLVDGVARARAYLLHLVGCTLFANKSATNVHVVHLRAFQDLGESGRCAWGAAMLYWIYEHFPSVHDCVTDDAYNETSPRACQWLTTKAYIKGLRAPAYQTCLDALTITDMCWMPYGDHRGVRGFKLISCFQGQTIPPPPINASLSYEDIDDRWMHYENHIADAGEIFVVLGQVSTDYVEWFFQISHLCVTPTQAGDEPRHPLAPQHEEYVEPGIPEDGYEGCEAITERLERVLNLRMVTKGTKLHEIVEDCLRIARGVTTQMEIVAKSQVFDTRMATGVEV
ncbi:Protein MAIN-LIKE 2 [Glycine soja]